MTTNVTLFNVLRHTAKGVFFGVSKSYYFVEIHRTSVCLP